MFTATIIISILLAIVLLLSGVGKLRRAESVMETMRKVQFPQDKLWLLASAEFAGALGLLAGLYWWPIGVAAAIGIIAYFVGALASHLRVKDWNVAAPGILMLVAVAALTLRLQSI